MESKSSKTLNEGDLNMDTVYVVEGYDLDNGRHRDVYANRETAIQIYNNVWYEFSNSGENESVKETESFTIQKIDEGFIRFATLSETEYIGVYVKTINTDIPDKP